KRRAAACGGKEQFVVRRIVNRTDPPDAVVHEGDRYTPVPNTVDEVQRAVDRIDDPCALGKRAAAFLAEHRVAGKYRGEPGAAKRFDRTIRDTDPVLQGAFRLGGVVELAMKIAQRQRAGFARECRGESRARVEVGVSHRPAVPSTS